MINKFLLIGIMFIFGGGCVVTHMHHGHHGPPGHARAHGHHKKHVQYIYNYYPDLEIYWHPYAGTWTVWRGGTWVTVYKRPTILAVHYDYVVINHKAAHPWKKHKHYKHKHPKKGKHKGKGHGKGKKW